MSALLSTLHAAFRAFRRLSLTSFAYLAAMLALPLLAGAINLGVKASAIDQARDAPPLSQPLPPTPAYDPAKKVAVVLSSAYGAEVTDFLPTYEILARSGVFNVYVVAPERRILPLIGAGRASGLDFVPHFSFAGYQAAIGRAPDLIAVPYSPGYTVSRDAAVLRWLRAQAGPRTTVLGICAGTAVLADTGLLDGHAATTNTSWFSSLAQQHPAVHWIRNVRYVDGGPVVTSTNLAAGMDATLHVVDRFAGRAVALAVARQIGYPTTRYLDDPRWRPSAANTAAIMPILANAAFRWGWERLGLVLRDGVGELRLASLVDPYTLSLSARIYTLAPARVPIRSEHGLYFVPRYTFTTAPHLDRVLVPGDSAGRWAYTSSLRDLARDQGDAVAADVGIGLFLPTAPGQRGEAGVPLAPLLVAPALSLLGASLVFGLGRLRRRPLRRHNRHVSAARPPRVRRVARQVGRFALHFVEMALAMELGMVALGGFDSALLRPAGLNLTGRSPELDVITMGVFMAAPMVAWMRLRGHGWRHGMEMAGAMVVPFAAAVILRVAGILPRADMMAFGSGLMWMAMLGIMLIRWSVYSGTAHKHGLPVTAATPVPIS